jgi:transcriptional regulator with XRE-family HTH domain
MSKPSPIKAAAAAQGLTLKEVAEHCGYSAGTIGLVSRGNVEPWPELRARLTALFGRDVLAETE